jgi:hypothetical protein
VNNSILEYILSPSVPVINALCLVAFEHDVRKLEQFADSCQDTEHLRQCFAGLKDLVKAVLHSELPEMAVNPQLKKMLFPRLDPTRVASILEKVSEIYLFLCELMCTVETFNKNWSYIVFIILSSYYANH